LRKLVRTLLATSLLATALVSIGAPTMAAPASTVTITCSNGFARTVAANAAKGITTSLNRFNAYRQSGVTCTAAAPTASTAPAQTYTYIDCTNGFTKRVSTHAAGGILRALNNFNAYSHTHVTCAVRT
jgi:hypothetical protein